MKRILLVGLLALAFSPASWAVTQDTDASQIPAYEQISDFHFYGRLDSWRPVDRDTLIVWATPFKPYLVELSRGSPDLRYAEVIGVTSTVGKVYAKFDSVLVGGVDYPIKAIYKLTRSQARSMREIQLVHRNA